MKTIKAYFFDNLKARCSAFDLSNKNIVLENIFVTQKSTEDEIFGKIVFKTALIFALLGSIGGFSAMYFAHSSFSSLLFPRIGFFLGAVAGLVLGIFIESSIVFLRPHIALMEIQSNEYRISEALMLLKKQGADFFRITK